MSKKQALLFVFRIKEMGYNELRHHRGDVPRATNGLYG